MLETVNWALPLVILPGVALLIMSTSMRVSQMHTEVHRLLDDHERVSSKVMNSLRQRSTLFRNALISLYLSVGTFALGGIIGVLTAEQSDYSDLLIVVFTGTGIACVLFAAFNLIRESAQAVLAIQAHIEQIDKKTD